MMWIQMDKTFEFQMKQNNHILLGIIIIIITATEKRTETGKEFFFTRSKWIKIKSFIIVFSSKLNPRISLNRTPILINIHPAV